MQFLSLLELEVSAGLLLFSEKKTIKNLITLCCSCRRSKSAEKAAKAGWMDAEVQRSL